MPSWLNQTEPCPRLRMFFTSALVSLMILKNKSGNFSDRLSIVLVERGGVGKGNGLQNYPVQSIFPLDHSQELSVGRGEGTSQDKELTKRGNCCLVIISPPAPCHIWGVTVVCVCVCVPLRQVWGAAYLFPQWGQGKDKISQLLPARS